MNTSQPKTTHHTNSTGIADAAQLAGSQGALAELLGVSRQAVSVWLKRGWVPAGRAIEIEDRFGIERTRLVSPRLMELVRPPVQTPPRC